MHMLTTMTRVLLLLCYYFATELIDYDHQFANSDTTLKMLLNNKHMIVLHDCDTKVCFE